MVNIFDCTSNEGFSEVIRFDESTKLLWIDAETVAEARSLYLAHTQLLGGFGIIRGIVYRRPDRLIVLIRNEIEIEEFIRPDQPRLSTLMEQAVENEPGRVELAIYCELTGRVCFSWENADMLTLWKSETDEPDGSETALRILNHTLPSVVPESLVGLWNAEFDGTAVQFYIACVDREYEVENGLWVSPSDLGGWKLDRSMVAAFSNSPRLAKLIRRSPA